MLPRAASSSYWAIHSDSEVRWGMSASISSRSYESIDFLGLRGLSDNSTLLVTVDVVVGPRIVALAAAPSSSGTSGTFASVIILLDFQCQLELRSHCSAIDPASDLSCDARSCAEISFSWVSVLLEHRYHIRVDNVASRAVVAAAFSRHGGGQQLLRSSLRERAPGSRRELQLGAPERRLINHILGLIGHLDLKLIR